MQAIIITISVYQCDGFIATCTFGLEVHSGWECTHSWVRLLSENRLPVKGLLYGSLLLISIVINGFSELAHKQLLVVHCSCAHSN